MIEGSDDAPLAPLLATQETSKAADTSALSPSPPHLEGGRVSDTLLSPTFSPSPVESSSPDLHLKDVAASRHKTPARDSKRVPKNEKKRALTKNTATKGSGFKHQKKQRG